MYFGQKIYLRHRECRNIQMTLIHFDLILWWIIMYIGNPSISRCQPLRSKHTVPSQLFYWQSIAKDSVYLTADCAHRLGKSVPELSFSQFVCECCQAPSTCFNRSYESPSKKKNLFGVHFGCCQFHTLCDRKPTINNSKQPAAFFDAIAIPCKIWTTQKKKNDTKFPKQEAGDGAVVPRNVYSQTSEYWKRFLWLIETN